MTKQEYEKAEESFALGFVPFRGTSINRMGHDDDITNEHCLKCERFNWKEDNDITGCSLVGLPIEEANGVIWDCARHQSGEAGRMEYFWTISHNFALRKLAASLEGKYDD